MTNTNKELLLLIDNELSVKEICNKLKISKKQLKRRLESIKYEGYDINSKYSYNGEKNYYLNKEPYSKTDSNRIKIYDVNEKNFKALAISDTHYGHTKENFDYINMIFDYAIKNDIHIILHLGDVMDGAVISEYDYKKQIEGFLTKYPISNNILTFLAFGNHEEDFIRNSSLNLSYIIEKERDDIVPLGYGLSELDIENNKIFMCHQKNFDFEYGLKLAGHSHRYKFMVTQNGPIVLVPTLSDYLHTTDYPGAIDIDIKIDSKSNFTELFLKHLTINDNKIKETSTIIYPFKRDTKIRKK